MIILVYSIKEESKEEGIKASKEVICPQCKEDCLIDMSNYRIKLYDCKNGNNIENISLEEYENTQEIDISKIICNICKINNKGQTFNNKFYVCNTCKKLYLTGKNKEPP